MLVTMSLLNLTIMSGKNLDTFGMPVGVQIHYCD